MVRTLPPAELEQLHAATPAQRARYLGRAAAANLREAARQAAEEEAATAARDRR